MSTAVEFAPHLTMGDAMARPLHGWKQHDPYAPRHSGGGGGYYPQERVQLPGPSALFTAVNNSHHHQHSSPPAPAARDVPPPYGSRPPYYSEYATPSPVGQTPPQLPAPNSDPHPMQARRPADVRLSPTQSTISSASDELELARYGMKGGAAAAAAPGAAALPRLPSNVHHFRNGQPAVEHKMPPQQSYPTPNGLSAHPPPPHQPSSPPAGPGSSPRSETKQMSITNLLSSDAGPKHPHHHQAAAAAETISASKAPMPSPARSTTSEYRIRVRQQPAAARSCGFGERDRRVIDPPPIVQLIIDDTDLTPEEVSRKIRHPFSVVHCSIWNETGEQDNSAMPEDYRQQRRLMGTLVASPFVGLDENGDEGCFFCFPDLSCRTPGSFRLKFAFVILDPLRMRPGGSSPIVATAMSDVFTVYNAKDFPGMQASTPLTKRLKEQGCLISIKKGNEKTSASHARDDDSDDDDDGAGSSAKPRKRQKKQ